MSKLLDAFIAFLDDPDESEFFITGVAGTGKTTSLAEVVKYCNDNKVSNITTAYTHRACAVLRSKLPGNAVVATLHSFLKKCPTINTKALKIHQVNGNAQVDLPEKVKVLLIDEFSMVGEKDYIDISALKFDENGEPQTKIVFIGDPNQLPPVKDVKAITPSKPYWIVLDKIHRQAHDNPLIDTLLTLNDFINGTKPEPLKEHQNFIRGQNITKLFSECKTTKILLAYTNAQVQHLNALIEGKEIAEPGDKLFSPTNRMFCTLVEKSKASVGIISIQNKLIELHSRFKTLETIHEIEGVEFYTVMDEDENEMPIACIFGHDSYLQTQKELANKAVFLNRTIEQTFNMDAKEWSKENRDHKLARDRAKAWSKFLAFKDCVYCLDFTHAMTVHKSQGSTYENVFLDTEDMSKCADNDYELYLKLLYVAISRASNKVYTN